jgi:hypothetical protein
MEVVTLYDVVVSLGYNCEISFRIEDFYGKLDAMPFSWSYILEQEKFDVVIKNFEMLMSGNTSLLPDHMIKCDLFSIKFHPRYELLLHNGEMSDASIEKATDELINRVKYLKEKFNRLLHSDKNTVFFMKVDYKDEELSINLIHKIYDAINDRYLTKKFTLVAIFEKKYITDELLSMETNQIKIRSLKKFAPKNHTDIMGDITGWFRILSEFGNNKNYGFFLRLSKRRIHWVIEYIRKQIQR